MDQSYKALPEHTHASGCRSLRLRLSEPTAEPHLSAIRPEPNHTPVAQAVAATPSGCRGRELKGRSRPALATTDPVGSAGAAYRAYRALSRRRTVPEGVAGGISPPRSRLLRRLVRLHSRLRSTLGALLLRRCIRLGVLLLEVRERIARLLLRQNPRATLRRSRTRIRPAKMRTHDLARNAQRSSEILRPVRLCVCHINHLLSVRCLHAKRITRDTRVAIVRGELYLWVGVRTFVRLCYATRSFCYATIRSRYGCTRQRLTWLIVVPHNDPPLRPPAIARTYVRRVARGAKRAGRRLFSQINRPAYKEAT